MCQLATQSRLTGFTLGNPSGEPPARQKLQSRHWPQHTRRAHYGERAVERYVVREPTGDARTKLGGGGVAEAIIRSALVWVNAKQGDHYVVTVQIH